MSEPELQKALQSEREAAIRECIHAVKDLRKYALLKAHSVNLSMIERRQEEAIALRLFDLIQMIEAKLS